MTLILSISQPPGPMITISDILVSAPGNRPNSVILPISGAQRVLSFNNHTVVSTIQKSIILDRRHLILWAGRQIVADHVVKSLRLAVAEGWNGNFHDFLDSLGLTESELASASFLFHRLAIEGGRIEILGHGVKMTNIGGHDVQFSGSGEFDFIDDITVNIPFREQNEGLNFLGPWVMRILTTITAEAIDESPLNYMYGGWFEITTTWDGAVFEKVPYLLKFWQVKRDAIVSHPSFLSHYNEGRLIIARIDSRNNQEDSSVSLHFVESCISEINLTDIDVSMCEFNPRFQLHVFQNDSGNIKFLLKEGDWNSYKIVFDQGIVYEEFDLGIIDTLQAAAAEHDEGGSITKPFSRL